MVCFWISTEVVELCPFHIDLLCICLLFYSLWYIYNLCLHVQDDCSLLLIFCVFLFNFKFQETFGCNSRIKPSLCTQLPFSVCEENVWLKRERERELYSCIYQVTQHIQLGNATSATELLFGLFCLFTILCLRRLITYILSILVDIICFQLARAFATRSTEMMARPFICRPQWTMH